MMKLKWKRTVIGGQTAHHDFMAYCEGGNFARVMMNEYGPSAGTWGWYLSCSRNPFYNLPYGTCDTKKDVIEIVVRMFDTLQERGELAFHPPLPKRLSVSDLD